MFRKIASLAVNPLPLRVRAARHVLEKFKFGSYNERLTLEAVERPYYGFCIYHAARLARALGQRSFSVIEFGVAGGNGLVNIEQHVAEIEAETGVKVEVYGFDMGSGLPPPRDHRDLPYIWREGFYAMDVDQLRSRLSRSQLVLGDVRETARTFFERYQPAPIGVAMIDLDFYSSTVDALTLFTNDSANYLPRILCYFDDVTGGPDQAYNEFTGELAAMREFNESSPRRKFAKLEVRHSRRFPAPWNDRIYVLHDFDHPQYSTYIGPKDDQRPLTAGANRASADGGDGAKVGDVGAGVLNGSPG